MRTSIKTGLLLSLLFFAECSKEKKVEIPKGILGKGAFTQVLVDFALAESAANTNIKNAPIMKIDSVYAFDPLKENHVSKGQYDSTLSFYAKHAGLYKEVYEDVLTRLTVMQTHRDSLKTHPASK